MASQPRYPNQQLRSVSVETFFPGRLRVLSALGEIQDAVDATLPNLFVPNIRDGEAVALRPFQLRDAHLRRSLAISVNQLTYVSFDYPGFAAFMEEAGPLLSSVHQVIRPTKLNRVVYRYENEVGIAREDDGTLPVERIFPGVFPPALGSEPGGGQCRILDAAFEHQWGSDSMKGIKGFHARVGAAAGADVLRVAVFGSVENCEDIKNMADAITAAHERAVALFESLISDGFRSFISSVREETDDVGNE